MLCISIGTDMLPAMAMAYEGPESDLMTRKPRDSKVDRMVTVVLVSHS